tara:strand:- start:50 stop:676 length:627 start_codon:yes stop_codon:yes gene_type:complete
MDLTSFLIIDFALALIAIPLILFSQVESTKSYIWEELTDNKFLNQSYRSIPSLNNLLELEKKAQADGSGIKFESLIGMWKFAFVWKKITDRKDSFFSFLLRLFSASLELKKNQKSETIEAYSFINSIKFGALKIQFIGCGELKGDQPLLMFNFDRIELSLGSNILLSRVITIADNKNRPFFMLIAIGEKRKWLSARGRGGGLALWIKD